MGLHLLIIAILTTQPVLLILDISLITIVILSHLRPFIIGYIRRLQTPRVIKTITINLTRRILTNLIEATLNGHIKDRRIVSHPVGPILDLTKDPTSAITQRITPLFKGLTSNLIWDNTIDHTEEAIMYLLGVPLVGFT